jgi:hypothetical protein
MRGTIALAYVALFATALAAQAPARSPTYDDLVRLYRSGSFESASSELRYQSLVTLDEDVVREWCRLARRQDRRDDLAAALLLHTEVIFDEVAANQGLVRDSFIVRVNGAALAAVHQELRGHARTMPVLRSWYVLWEAFRQGFGFAGSAPLADYLDSGLEAFPDDADLQLSAGSRHELRWWKASGNPQRDPSARPRGSDSVLQEARRHYARSLEANPKSTEAHLRLGRVLTLLGEFDAAGEQLTGAAQSGQAAFEYLRLLFLGDLHERQDDAGGAAAAYEEAIGLTPNAQSARLAAAQLAHSVGRRSDAARGAMLAMDGPLTDADPWWIYLRGQWWRLGPYLKQSRALVAGAAAGKTAR